MKPKPNRRFITTSVVITLLLTITLYFTFYSSSSIGLSTSSAVGKPTRVHIQTIPDRSLFEEIVEKDGDTIIRRKQYIKETYERENATIFTLARNEELYQLLATIKNFEDRFNKNFHYDWVFANNEEFSDEFIEEVSHLCSGSAIFVHLPQEMWDYPEFIDQEKAAVVRHNMKKSGVKYGESESYRHMCRFFSGLFFQLPAMQQYRYYWRVEPGVEFRCSMRYDLFRVMRQEERVYGFTLAPLELHTTVPTLYDSVKEYAKEFPDRIAKSNNADFLTDDGGETYNMCHFWSNFEIGDMEFFRSESYQQFFDYLDKKGGIYYERWGDAPIHTLAVSYLLPWTKLRYFSNTGYFHFPNLQCDGSAQMIADNECLCSAADDSAWSAGSCISKFFDIHDIKRPDYAPTDKYLPIHDHKLRHIEERRRALLAEGVPEEDIMAIIAKEDAEKEAEKEEKEKQRMENRRKRAKMRAQHRAERRAKMAALREAKEKEEKEKAGKEEGGEAKDVKKNEEEDKKEEAKKVEGAKKLDVQKEEPQKEKPQKEELQKEEPQKEEPQKEGEPKEKKVNNIEEPKEPKDQPKKGTGEKRDERNVEDPEADRDIRKLAQEEAEAEAGEAREWKKLGLEAKPQ